MAEHDDVGRFESTQTESSRVYPLSGAPRNQMVLLVIDGYVWPVFYDHSSDKWVWFVNNTQPDGWMPMPEPPTNTGADHE